VEVFDRVLRIALAESPIELKTDKHRRGQKWRHDRQGPHYPQNTHGRILGFPGAVRAHDGGALGNYYSPFRCGFLAFLGRNNSAPTSAMPPERTRAIRSLLLSKCKVLEKSPQAP